MQPHRGPKSKRATTRAAQNYLRSRLGWLRGYPEPAESQQDVVWITLPQSGSAKSSERLIVDPERLRKAEYTRNAARRRFPKALPEIVGNISEWTRHTDVRLTILKDAVHRQKPTPGLHKLMQSAGLRRSVTERIATLRRREKRLDPLLTALVWCHWETLDELETSIAVVEAHVDPISRIFDHCDRGPAVAHALTCIELVATGADTWFMDALAHEVVWQAPIGHNDLVAKLRQPLKALKQQSDDPDAGKVFPIERPAKRLSQEILKSLSGLCGVAVQRRNAQTKILKSLVDTGIAQEWLEWWDRAARLEREVRRLSAIGWAKAGKKERDQGKKLSKRISDELDPPPNVKMRELTELAAAIAENFTPGGLKLLNDCIDLVPAIPRRREQVTRFLNNWSNEVADAHASKRTIIALLKAQAHLLRNLTTPASKAWFWALGELSYHAGQTWLRDNQPVALVKRAFGIVARILDGHEDWTNPPQLVDHYWGWESLIESLVVCNDDNFIARVIARVPSGQLHSYGSYWTPLVRISGFDAATFEKLARDWRSADWPYELSEVFDDISQDPAVCDLVRTALLEGEIRRIRSAVALTRLCRGLKAGALSMGPDGPAESDWIAEYPAEFAETLGQMAKWDDNAERAAKQILGRQFPSQSQIAREIQALQEKLLDAGGQTREHLEVRLEKLRAWQADPSAVSANQLSKLKTKLDQRILHARLLHWERALRQTAKHALADRFQIELGNDVFEDPDTLVIFSSLLDLDAPIRHLGFRLFRDVQGPPPWDMRNESANAAFLRRMQALGRDTTPWLDGIGDEQFDISGRPYILTLEDDPVEVMKMGAPFETCLAPGSFNFFSAVSNAADINKRVIYVRDDKGAVYGRCLVALTDDGHVLSFRIYGHGEYKSLEKRISGFIKRLAAAVGGVVVIGGRVSKLVAPDWYDDGPVDLTGQLEVLQKSKRFHDKLTRVSPDRLMATLEKWLDGHPITPSLVLILSNLEVFYRRQELLVPLLNDLGRFGRIDNWTRIELARVALRASERDRAEDLLQPCLRARFADDHHVYFQRESLTELLIELDRPHQALSQLRRTRWQGVRRWEDEAADRQILAGRAYQALKRPHRALQLFRMALKQGHKGAKPYVMELEKALEDA